MYSLEMGLKSDFLKFGHCHIEETPLNLTLKAMDHTHTLEDLKLVKISSNVVSKKS